MTVNAARANRPIRETDLGGRLGDPVDLHCFSPVETAARILAGELTPALVEQVEVGAAFLPRARKGLHKCVQCRGALTEHQAWSRGSKHPQAGNEPCSESARTATVRISNRS
jgi:hypothetical protein